MNRLVKGCSSSLLGISANRSEEIAFGRFLRNEKVDEKKLISGIAEETSKRCKGRHVLVLQDSTEINYRKHLELIDEDSGLGVVGNNEDIGYFMHPSLVLESQNYGMLGLSDIMLWTRDQNRQKTTKTATRDLIIEEKESYKWIQSSDQSKQVLKEAEHIIFVQDREADIYENFCLLSGEKSDFIIRSSWNRRLEEGYAFDRIKEEHSLGEISLILNGENKKRKKRTTELEVRVSRLRIKRPRKKRYNNENNYPEYIEVTLLEAKEREGSIPTNETGVNWKIWTSLTINNIKDAETILRHYQARWKIEELFRTIKSKGFNIENSRLRTGYSLRKLGILTLHAATQVLQLTQSRENKPNQPISDGFENIEIKILENLCKKYEGATAKQKNPFPKSSLGWASWIIARIGGWKGYQSQRPPGNITMLRGLERFNLIMTGFQFSS